MTEKKDTRCRNFATIVYPDSVPDNWQEIISDSFIPCFISPLHDRDLNPTGEPKKAHYHVMFMFDGKKSIEQVEAIIKLFNGVGCQKINSIRGYARYLCHLDNPEKAQYDIGSVRSLAGADYPGTIGLATDKYKAIGEMIDFCIERKIYSYSELVEFSRSERFDWFRVLCDNGSYVMKEYLKSKSWTAEKENCISP